MDLMLKSARNKLHLHLPLVAALEQRCHNWLARGDVSRVSGGARAMAFAARLAGRYARVGHRFVAAAGWDYPWPLPSLALGLLARLGPLPGGWGPGADRVTAGLAGRPELPQPSGAALRVASFPPQWGQGPEQLRGWPAKRLTSFLSQAEVMAVPFEVARAAGASTAEATSVEPLTQRWLRAELPGTAASASPAGRLNWLPGLVTRQLESIRKIAGRAPTPGTSAAWEPPLLGYSNRLSEPGYLPDPLTGPWLGLSLNLAHRRSLRPIEPGLPLSPELRQPLEQSMGYDLGRVRLHTDSAAAALAFQLRARAFTVGPHIFFAAGEYRPHTRPGLALLAHELAHVRQQPHGSALLAHTQHQTLEQEARQHTQAVLAGVSLPVARPLFNPTWPRLAAGYSAGQLAGLEAELGQRELRGAGIGPVDSPGDYPALLLAHASGMALASPLRQEAGAASEAPATPPPLSPAMAAGPPAAPAAPDVEQLAEQVYTLIRRRERIKQEQRGIQRWP